MRKLNHSALENEVYRIGRNMMKNPYLQNLSLSAGFLVSSSCYVQNSQTMVPGSSGVFESPGTNGACYYLSPEDYNFAVDLFKEIGQIYPREIWLSLNGHPCDEFPDLQGVPREDCVRCTEEIFATVGW